jgi:Rhodopirellula transposase DDE domain
LSGHRPRDIHTGAQTPRELAALKNYWKILILDTIDNALKIAAKMTWKGMNLIVSFIDKIYKTGIKISDEEFEEINPFIQKNPDLKKWDVKILNKIDR